MIPHEGAGQLRLTGKLKGYLLMCCVNRARDLLRRKKHEPRADRALDARHSPGERPDAAASRLEEAARVAAALAEIPAEQREVTVLKVWGQLTFKEIADLLGISPNTAASRHRYALAALRKLLAPEGAA